MRELFDKLPLARSSDPITSHAGADDVAPRLAPQARAVLRALDKSGPQTASELGLLMFNAVLNWKRLQWPHKRAIMLERAGLIKREILPGYKGMVMSITEAGIKWLKEIGSGDF